MPQPDAYQLLFGDEAGPEPRIDAADPLELEPACVSCRSTDVRSIGSDMRQCRSCGAAMSIDRRSGQWVRLAAIFGGGSLRKPRPKQKRWPQRRGWSR